MKTFMSWIGVTGLQPINFILHRKFCLKLLPLLVCLIMMFHSLSGQSSAYWTQKANFGGGAREYGVGFSIEDKGYLGTGAIWKNGRWYKLCNDFWEYDPVTDVWAQKADFGGTARYGAVGFSIDKMGYVGTGMSNGFFISYNVLNRDFWGYDPKENTWTQKSDFGGTVRWRATGFSLQGKGYVGTGYDEGKHGAWPFRSDFWEYDPATDKWSQKTDFPGKGRYDATGFCIGDKGYIGTGMEYLLDGTIFEDFWAYDPLTDSWEQRADFGGGRVKGAIGFAIGNKGYLGTGSNFRFWPWTPTNEFWEYDPLTDSWLQIADAGIKPRIFATAFVLNNRGYMGTGSYADEDGRYLYYNDFWEFAPASQPACMVPTELATSGISSTTAELNWQTVPSAIGYKIEYEDANGSELPIATFEKSGSKTITNLKPNTVYSWRVKSICALDPKEVSDWSVKQYFNTSTLKYASEFTSLIEVYPNPVSEHFTLSFQLCSDTLAGYSTQNTSITLYLLNTLGQVVYASNEMAGNGKLIRQMAMPTTAASGWYVIRAVTIDQIIEQKVFYQK